MKKQLVVYHGGCIDGWASAWAAWRRFGDDAEYVEGWYGRPAPDVTGRDVLIVDFSYQRDVLLDMKAKANSLRVLDHHASAQKELEGLDFCLFDMNRSGAGITWDELNDAMRPALIDYVEDRDLWRFALHRSQAINAWIGSYPTGTFLGWEDMAKTLHYEWERCCVEGEAVLRAQSRYVAEMAKQSRVRAIGGHGVPVVNAPYISTSELVGHLAEPRWVPFAAGWYQRGDGLYSYSLRSRHGFDVAELATTFGGGGHKAAAGFTVAERMDFEWY